MRPLTDRQKKIVLLLDEEWPTPMTPNQMGYKLGFNRGQDAGLTTRQGRVMGPAQRVIGSLNGLNARSLIAFRRRPDGLSGTAYTVSEEGRRYAAEHRKAMGVAR